jgi:hypothetical protein
VQQCWKEKKENYFKDNCAWFPIDSNVFSLIVRYLCREE